MRAQLERYAGLDTAQRRTNLQRVRQRVRMQFEEHQDPTQPGGACAFDVVLDDAIYPLNRAAEAYERMMSGKARFRVVLVPGK
ncbi:hypothetical protein LMG28688_02039 [Paraburkholderia caffeinitolerans]|uniref:Uncharacterized protein n=1 Tax=Paraburkholderia caffeinitolerans TaxID=1723730 RepID=A0A6J5FVA5_9BURK|nr:hypothetical protein [Paraburkholderia caffeinitolerans]CAB3785446.1 hypothetical protein LMG28688_02039 [Paraburkholderia caffeinitolerans]